MSFDPVAHDTVGLGVWTQALADEAGNPAPPVSVATPCLEGSAELGLGTNDPANMDLRESWNSPWSIYPHQQLGQGQLGQRAKLQVGPAQVKLPGQRVGHRHAVQSGALGG